MQAPQRRAALTVSEAMDVDAESMAASAAEAESGPAQRQAKDTSTFTPASPEPSLSERATDTMKEVREQLQASPTIAVSITVGVALLCILALATFILSRRSPRILDARRVTHSSEADGSDSSSQQKRKSQGQRNYKRRNAASVQKPGSSEATPTRQTDTAPPSPSQAATSTQKERRHPAKSDDSDLRRSPRLNKKPE